MQLPEDVGDVVRQHAAADRQSSMQGSTRSGSAVEEATCRDVEAIVLLLQCCVHLPHDAQELHDMKHACC